jgi:putative transposase
MNTYNPNIHHRKSIRLKGYDYAQAGLYFITICVQNRECLFGNITVGANPCGRPNDDKNRPEMILNDAGKMIEREWLNLKNRFHNIKLHEYITMPNHFHGILEITVRATPVVTPNDDNKKGQPLVVAPTDKTVGDMMDAFKSITTVEYIRGVKNLDWKPFNGKLWQRNYYEHIIRNEKSYQTISNYIINNCAKWKEDKFYK